MITAKKVCALLDISYYTLNHWYKWYLDGNIKKPEVMPSLPIPYRGENNKGTRQWKEEDIAQLQAFKNWLPRGRAGIMGQVTQAYLRKKKAAQDIKSKEELTNG